MAFFFPLSFVVIFSLEIKLNHQLCLLCYRGSCFQSYFGTVDFAEHVQLNLWKPVFHLPIDHRKEGMFAQVIVKVLMCDQEELFHHSLSFTAG